MNELSLFTGAGGGLLGTKLLGWKNVGYVEINEHCQRVIRQRIEDRLLEDAPIYGDIKTFISDGYAECYQGLVDIITAGFTCQPESRIGSQLGESDERYIWPETINTIRIIRPGAVLLENTAGITDTGTAGRVTAELAACGYVGHYMPLSALGLGANHQRTRIWFVAFDSNAIGDRLEGRDLGAQEWKGTQRSIQTFRENQIRMDLPDPGSFGSCNDVANRVERLRAIGNGQVPGVVRAAWRILTGND